MRALTSASNIARREACPGSAYAESLFPEQEDSDESKEGTLLHSVDADPSLAETSGLTSEQVEVLERARTCDEEIFSSLHLSIGITEDEPFEEIREEKLWFYRGIKKLYPGHVDRARFYPNQKVMVVIDKKFGRREVTPAEANLQLRSYAMMIGEKRWKPERILVAIVQPRLRFEDRLSMAEYFSESFADARAHLLRIWDASHDENGDPREDAPRVANDNEQCRYCRAKLSCDAYRAKYTWLTSPASDGKESFVAKLGTLSDEKLDEIWLAIGFAKLIEPDAKKEIARRIAAGGMVMYEQAETGNTSTITDVPKAIDLLENYGIAKEEIMKCASLRKEDLAEKIKVQDECTIAHAKKRLGQVLRTVLKITPKSPSLQRLPAGVVRSDAAEIPAETTQSQLL